MKYLVIAVSLGDGDDFGHRIWSERVESMSAADKISQFLHNAAPDVRVYIIKDGE